MRGGTFYFCWGSYAGFHIEFNKRAKRLVLGKVAIGYLKLDIEVLLVKLIEKLNVESL